MMSREQAVAIAQRTLGAAKKTADDARLFLGGGRVATVALRAEAPPETRCVAGYTAELRVRLRGAIGVARTVALDDASLRALVDTALARASVTPAKHALMPLPPVTAQREPTTFDPEVAQLPPAGLVALLAPAVLRARRYGVALEGVLAARGGSLGVGADDGTFAVAHTGGLFHFHRTSRVRLSVWARAGEGRAYGEHEHWLLRAFNPAALLDRLLVRARLLSSPKPLGAGEYTVILEPAALAAFLRSLAPHFSADAVAESRSFLRGRVGRGVVMSNITLRDDFAHPLHAALPYDGEGQPRRAVTLLDRGVVRAFTYSRAQAWRASEPPTGHAPVWPARGDAMPRHLVLEGQPQSLNALIASVKRGVLIARVAGHRVVDGSRAVCAGATCGAFWIEGGRVRHAVTDLRYEMSAYDVLAYATRLSRAVLADGVVAPALITNKFRILGRAR